MSADISLSSYRAPTMGDALLLFLRAQFYWILGAVLGAVLAFGFMAAAVPHYKAEMLIGPAERASSGPDIKALLPDNSSFAVQYLVNTLGSPDSTDFIRFENIVREPSVAARLLQDKAIIYGVVKNRPLEFMAEHERPATAEELAAYLQKYVSIEPVGISPLRRLVYRHPDRDFAAYLLTQIHLAADDIIRQEIRDKTASRAAYLREALESVQHPDHRRALTSLLMEQEHVRMILAIDEPFAAMVAEPAFAGVKPAWPRKAVIVPVLAFIGAFLGFALYALRCG